jgi:hypothetical protein
MPAHTSPDIASTSPIAIMIQPIEPPTFASGTRPLRRPSSGYFFAS